MSLPLVLETGKDEVDAKPRQEQLLRIISVLILQYANPQEHPGKAAIHEQQTSLGPMNQSNQIKDQR